MKEKKLSFLKKIKISIFDFDGYEKLATEKVSRTLLYIALLILIFSIIMGMTYIYKFIEGKNATYKYIENEIAEINYNDYQLTVRPNNNDEITRIEQENIGIKIIINAQTNDENKINDTLNEIKNTQNGILILKDKIVIKMYTKNIELSYKSISEMYNINKIDKTEILNILSGNEMKTFIITLFFGIVIYIFIIFISNILVDMFLLTVLAYLVARIAGLRLLKYSAVYNIATYSLTLPIILNIIYFIINAFTGFVIEYFQIMYTAIASIYIITAILIIKSDIIKKQIELNKIVEEQKKVKQELQEREEEQKEEKQEKEENEHGENKKDKENDRKNDETQPEGENA